MATDFARNEKDHLKNELERICKLHKDEVMQNETRAFCIMNLCEYVRE